MDIRMMEYFLAVTREGTILGASETLHVSQPALSRQMSALEEELGVTLFVRGNRRITLTEGGMILRKRAEEILSLVSQTEQEVTQAQDKISGDIYIGSGESPVFHYLSQAASIIREKHPDVRFHITSGDTEDLTEQLNRGLLDFAVLFTDFDRSLYQSVSLPVQDRFGLLMRKGDPLTKKETINMDDLKDLPVMVSRASAPYFKSSSLFSILNIIGTYNLIYNASLMVEDGVGYALAFDKLVPTGAKDPLCFRPLNVPNIPTIITGSVVWKKYQVFSPAVQLFIDTLKDSIPTSSGSFHSM